MPIIIKIGNAIGQIASALSSGPLNTVAPVISGITERGEVLTTTNGTWDGEGVITYAYQWRRDNIDIVGATNNTYTLVEADDNSFITCIVFATDDNGTSRKSSNSLGPVLGAPLNLTAPVLSGVEEVGETLSVTDGTWQGAPVISYSYQWKRNGANIAGATSSTYVLVNADDKTIITCEVTATNSLGSASELSNATGLILGSPILVSNPVISGTARAGETLSTTDGVWDGIAVISYTYQWRRDTIDIVGATSSTYTLVADDYDTDIDCVVTATNSVGSDSADSNDLGPIAGLVPVITGVPTISGSATVDSELTAIAASVSGVPTPTTTWQWQISDDGVSGWSNITGETSITYTIDASDEGKYLRVVQTETNVEGSDFANSLATDEITDFVGLLDDYPNAAAAYSVRLLSGSYTGALVRIRKDTGGQPEKDFYPDENGELSLNSSDGGTTLGSWIGNNDGYIVTWYDQSGNSNDATQATAIEQPQILSGGSLITDNGKAAIQFDGTAQNIILPGLHNLSRLDIFRAHQTTDTQFTMISEDGSITDRGFTAQSSSTSSGLPANFGTPSLYVNSVLTSISTRADSYLAFLNQKIHSVIDSDTTSWADFAIGGAGSFKFSGKVHEFIGYDSNQSTNRTGIETNINDFFIVYPDTAVSGLLYDYPNAEAAYSVRQLTIYNNGYKERLVRVRRSSDNAETDVFADANYELSLNSLTGNGTSLSTWIGSDNGFVVSWYDQSGNSLDLTQASASAQPQILSSGSLITDNGKVAAQLTGNEEFIKAISWNTNLYSQFSVMSNSSSGSLISLDNGSIWLRDNGSAMFVQYSGNFFNATLTTTQQAIYHGYDGTNHIYNRNDGTETLSAATTAQGTVTELSMFARRSGINRVSGKFQEAIFYLSDQSANISDIQTNQNDFYSIY